MGEASKHPCLQIEAAAQFVSVSVRQPIFRSHKNNLHNLLHFLRSYAVLLDHFHEAQLVPPTPLQHTHAHE